MSDQVFSGGDGLAPGSMEQHTYQIMMQSELLNGKGAYELGNAGSASSGPSFGPFQYDVGASQDGRNLLESIATNAKDAQGHRIVSSEELSSVKSHLYKPFNTFNDADRVVYTQLKPKLDAALNSDDGVRAINADFVPGVQKKIAAMNAEVDGMATGPNKTFVQNSDVAKLILIDTKNQYGGSVNDGLKEFIDRTKDDSAMSMPGRSHGATIAVDGDFGLDDMVRYKLETQYGQSDKGAKDVLRRISNCVEAVGVEKVKAGLSEEDKKFFETGLEKYLKDHGRDTKILDTPQLKALAELGGREQHQARSHINIEASDANSLLREGSKGDEIKALQSNLFKLGFTDAHGRNLNPDGNFGADTKAAVKKFQDANHLTSDGVVGSTTGDAINAKLLEAAQTSPSLTLTDAAHPGNAMYMQSLEAVHRLDAQKGRTPDQVSENFAGVLALAARDNGMTRVDHVVLSDDASRAFAVQGDMKSLFKRYTDVNVAQAIATPLDQTSAQWSHNMQQQTTAQNTPPTQQMQNPQGDQPVMR